PLCVCRDISQVKEKFTPGDIIVVPYTSNEIIQYLKTAAGIITEEAGDTSHAAIVGLSLDIPVIIGATNATKILRPGAVVTLDSAKGVVYTN
ncbi:MAG: pyruvate kinase, partial [Clostridia bacterium]|nr:pyruvate kinase [Clostridia bacterium]